MKSNIFLITLFINTIYLIILFNHPKSTIYHLNQIEDKELTEYLFENINYDSKSYIEFKNDGLRTIGYPMLIKLVKNQFPNNWIVAIMILQAILSAGIYVIVYDLLEKKVFIWPIILLGTYIIYVPYIQTEITFAFFFLLSIWFIRKNIWFHFLFLGIASIIRPSLAWIFIVEPFVLYFYGLEKLIIYLSIPVTFFVTSFNRFYNLKYTGKFVHSTVLKYNIESESYFNKGSKIIYPIKAFMGNGLSGHYDFLGNLFNSYKRDYGRKKASKLMWYSNIICVLINLLIWMRFVYMVIKRKVNYGNVILVAYIIAPTLFASAGARIRIPVEFLLF